MKSLGAVGDTWETNTASYVDVARVVKFKTTVNAGTMEITVNADPADAGQVALRAALAAKGSYAFKVEFPDKPSAGASPKPSARYFTALVTKIEDKSDEAGNAWELTATLEITSNIVAVAASAT